MTETATHDSDSRLTFLKHNCNELQLALIQFITDPHTRVFTETMKEKEQREIMKKTF